MVVLILKHIRLICALFAKPIVAGKASVYLKSWKPGYLVIELLFCSIVFLAKEHMVRSRIVSKEMSLSQEGAVAKKPLLLENEYRT